MRIRGIIAGFLLSLCLAFQANAHDYALWPLPATQPGHVHSLWVNINQILLRVAEGDLRHPDRFERMNALKPGTFPTKIPRDVLGQVNRFRTLLDRQRKLQQMGGSANSRAGPGDLVEPKTVFINSLLVLDSLQNWEQTVYGNIKSYDEFYRFHHDENITPTEVYAQVDLAIRRLQLISN